MIFNKKNLFNFIIISIFISRIGRRAGYNKTVTDEMCSQWKYRPSEKYIASIQY